MITLTAEQAQQIEEALLTCEIHDDGEIRYSSFDNDKIWDAIDTIRAARAQEPTNLCQNSTELVEKDCGGAHHHCYAGSFGG